MVANARSVAQVFEPSIRLVAPLFQRPYVWRADENWLPLWEAIEDTTEARLSGQPRPYFLGAVVLAQQLSSTGDGDHRDVIDGQQRCTTLQVLLAALRDSAEENGDPGYPQRLSGMLVIGGVGNKPSEPKMTPTTVDREAFRQVVRAGSRQAVAQIKEPRRFREAYEFFRDKIDAFLKGPGRDERIAALFDTLRHDLQLVIIDLDPKDDAQLIFETLNALGQPLLPSDLIKNYLLSRAGHVGADAEELYRKYWKHFETDASFWRQEIIQGRLKRQRLDAFFQAFLNAQLGKEVLAGAIFQEFRGWAGNVRTTASAETSLAEIAKYAAIFKRIEEGHPNPLVCQFLKTMEVLENRVTIPLLMKFLAQNPSDEETEKMVSTLESYLVRRLLTRGATNSYTRMFTDVIAAEKDGITASGVARHLLSREDKLAWPDDEALKWASTRYQTYGQMRRNRIEFLLRIYEMSLHGKNQEAVAFTGDHTIEHIIPQKDGKWPLGADESADERKYAINLIGNLTLLTQPMNAAVSNGPWKDKRAAFLKETLLQMTKAVAGRETWTPHDVWERSEAIAEAVAKRYPRPEGNARSEPGPNSVAPDEPAQIDEARTIIREATQLEIDRATFEKLVEGDRFELRIPGEGTYRLTQVQLAERLQPWFASSRYQDGKPIHLPEDGLDFLPEYGLGESGSLSYGRLIPSSRSVDWVTALTAR